MSDENRHEAAISLMPLAIQMSTTQKQTLAGVAPEVNIDLHEAAAKAYAAAGAIVRARNLYHKAWREAQRAERKALAEADAPKLKLA